MGGEPLTDHGTGHPADQQRQHQGQLVRRPVPQRQQRHQAVEGDQQQAGAAGQLHRQPRQQHQGRHDGKATTHAGDAGQQTHQNALHGQGQGRGGRPQNSLQWQGRVGASAGPAQHQPRSDQGRCREDGQLGHLGYQAGFDQAAADPAACQSRDAQNQRRSRCDLPSPQVGDRVADGQHHHDDQRQRYSRVGGQAGTGHQQRQQQNRAPGPQDRQQKADQPATGDQQQHDRGNHHTVTRFQGIAASSLAMPQNPLMPANIRPAPTKPLSQIQPGATNWLRRTPDNTRVPATICT